MILIIYLLPEQVQLDVNSPPVVAANHMNAPISLLRDPTTSTQLPSEDCTEMACLKIEVPLTPLHTADPY